MELDFNHNDGGRAKYFKGSTGDCVTRAIAIATNIDYKIVYDDLFLANKEYISKRNNKISRALRNRHNGLSPRSGIFKDIYTKYLTDLGWKYVSLIKFGSKERTKLDQLTHFDNIIITINKHLMCMQKGVLQDISDFRFSYWEERKSIRTANGYFIKEI